MANGVMAISAMAVGISVMRPMAANQWHVAGMA